MLDLINGLPLHPLVVHAVVVLLPLAALGAIAIALRASWRAAYGPLVSAAGVLSVVLLPIATGSGEALQERVGDPGQHAALGEQLILFAIPLAVVSVALTYFGRRQDAGRPLAVPTWAPRAVAGLAILAALATSVQVYRVGDSGAKAVWESRVGTSASR